jgi:hypothetical protein
MSRIYFSSFRIFQASLFILYSAFIEHNKALTLPFPGMHHHHLDKMLDMSFHPLRRGLHDFSSINRRVIAGALKPWNILA